MRHSKGFTTGIAALLAILLTACDYDQPLTPEPTRKVDQRLVGKWVLHQRQAMEWITIAAYDDSTYVISSGGDLYRAFHSDFAQLPLVSVQELSGAKKYKYVAFELDADGKHLTLRSINAKLIPDGAGVRERIEKQRENPELFESLGVYTKED